MHYLIIITIIVGIVIWQTLSFLSNRKKILSFENIFPNSQGKFELVQDEIKNHVLGIKTSHKNTVLEVIIASLNKYLINNKGAVSDFHLMKDIVDRNCDAKEEEIHSQIPVPLYLGLVGTMAGILVGVGFLVFSGGLESLVSNSPNVANGINQNAIQGVNGIKALMGGVALAMISSILGILLTTFGSYKSRNAKANIEKNKNTFLSWIQAELLPNISNNTSSALVRMTKNLTSFNKTFSQNTQDLGSTLSKVNDTTQRQAEFIQAINRMKIEDIVEANKNVYDKLKNSANDVGVFAQYLQKTNEYLQAIRDLNQKLDEYERRTQVIEDAGRFFTKNEKWLAENFDIANLEVKAALKRFKDDTGKSLAKLQESLNEQILDLDDLLHRQQEMLQNTLASITEILSGSLLKTQQAFEKAIKDQQYALQEKLQETSKLIDELKNLKHIKEGIKDFKVATNQQNQKIDALTNEIRVLAKAKIEGGTIKQEITLPKWIKLLIISGSTLVAVTCLFFIIPPLIEWIKNLVNWIF